MAKSNTDKRMEHQWMAHKVRYITPDGIKGMTLDYYHALVTFQSGQCKCCSESQQSSLEPNWNLNTGILRGLICIKCKRILTKETNTLQWPDDPKLIRSIANRTNDPLYIKAAIFVENNP